MKEVSLLEAHPSSGYWDFIPFLSLCFLVTMMWTGLFHHVLLPWHTIGAKQHGQATMDWILHTCEPKWNLPPFRLITSSILSQWQKTNTDAFPELSPFNWKYSSLCLLTLCICLFKGTYTFEHFFYFNLPICFPHTASSFRTGTLFFTCKPNLMSGTQ